MVELKSWDYAHLLELCVNKFQSVDSALDLYVAENFEVEFVRKVRDDKEYYFALARVLNLLYLSSKQKEEKERLDKIHSKRSKKE